MPCADDCESNHILEDIPDPYKAILFAELVFWSIYWKQTPSRVVRAPTLVDADNLVAKRWIGGSHVE